ncbi:MAG: pyridoxamine 5'-phosphate oxidase family protein [Pseudomonadota bacterium]
MPEFADADVISSPEALRALYGEPSKRSLVKEVDHIAEVYRPFIETAPFVLVASVGPEGVDVSPRGDPQGFVRVADPKTLYLPDRRGNNRADTLMNVVRDPRLSLLFMIPGVGETMRVTGHGRVVVNQDLCEQLAEQGKPARSVLVVDVHAAYFQCQKALARSRLWDPAAQVSRGTVPTAGDMIKFFDADFDSAAYDAGYADYMKETIY